MATSTPHPANSRLVVLLKPGDKKRLQKLARDENVSSSEIVRRSLRHYNTGTREVAANEADLKAALAEVNDQLDMALSTVRSARLEVAQNIAKIRKIREQAG